MPRNHEREDELPDPERLSSDEQPPRRDRPDGDSRWRREAGVFVSWRPPNWASENSRRL